MQKETLIKILFIWAGFLILPLFSYTQEKITGESTGEEDNAILLEQADKFTIDVSIAEGAARLIGNVIIKHKNTRMTCDSA